jgi:signal transduction histidine kinase
MRDRSIRSRVTTASSVVVICLLALIGLLLVVAQRHLLTLGIDEAVVQAVDNLEPAVVGAGRAAKLPPPGDPEDSFTILVDADGGLVSKVGSTPMFVRPSASELSIATVEFANLVGRRYRVLARPVATVDGPMTIVEGKNLDDVDESVTTLATTLGVALPVSVVVLAGLVWWITGKVLGPVEAIRAEVSGIGAGELNRRVPEPGTGDEIQRLASTMNAMLERIEDAHTQQRRFIDDAAHELKTPLARLRSELDVHVAHPEDPEAMLRRLGVEVEELDALLQDLLLLSRIDASGRPIQEQEVDLDDVALSEASRVRPDVVVDKTGVTAVRTVGDPAQLARAVRNLLDNAARHATSTVAVGVRRHGDRAELTVDDDGNGVPDDSRERIFDRFARLDDSRTRNAGGVGLGLAIARGIARAHGGDLVVGQSELGGARFVLALPAVDEG